MSPSLTTVLRLCSISETVDELLASGATGQQALARLRDEGVWEGALLVATCQASLAALPAQQQALYPGWGWPSCGVPLITPAGLQLLQRAFAASR